ncbi:MAG: putative membrane protein [Paracoccaceae bacterium]|jgi:uncharacterized membrane protein
MLKIPAMFLTFFLILFGPAAAQEMRVDPELFDVKNVASDDVLNIRRDPNGSSDKIGVLSHDQTSVEVIATVDSGKWGLVNSDEGSGWVSMRFMQPSSSTSENFPAGLVCSGTEPFWFLEFNLDGSADADWSPMGLTDEQNSIYADFWSSRPQNRITKTYGFELLKELTGSGVRANGLIRTELCNDGMSDREFGFSIDLMLAGPERKLISGCCSIRP